jgi:LAS superfamily LD-carboxypeptidase LdcB
LSWLPDAGGDLKLTARMRTPWLLGVLCWIALSVGYAEARSVTAFSRGQKTRIKLVEIGGTELEARAARAFETMAEAARAAGIELSIRSGFRSHTQQQRLYRRYRSGRGNLAARPGYSNHENGRAIDVVLGDGVLAWLEANAPAYGFRRTVAREPWHWEYVARKRAPRRRG